MGEDVKCQKKITFGPHICPVFFVALLQASVVSNVYKDCRVTGLI